MSIRVKSNSGRVGSSASTIACAIVCAATVVGAWIVCLPNAYGADSLERILRGVEDRYNHTETLEVAFAETSMAHGRKYTENGELYLRKPGRTRWEYKIPAGKLFGSDGKYEYAYFPDEKRFEKMSLKESDDMKAPLGFLLGKMHFDNEFKNFRTEPDGPSTFITCTPKSDKAPYKEVTFLIDPNFTIRWLNVKGQDGSQLDFAFNSEKRNVPIAESMFKFIPPLGVMYTDSSQRP